MKTRIGIATVTHSARGIATYSVEVFHDGLHKHTLIKAPDRQILINKANAVAQRWDESWNKQVACETRIKATWEAKEARKLHLENQKEQAIERTAEAQGNLDQLKTLLLRGMELDPTIDWEDLKEREPFLKKRPVKPSFPQTPVPPNAPRQPEKALLNYQPQLSLLDRLIPSRKVTRIAAAERQYDADLKRWRDQCSQMTSAYQAAVEAHNKACAKLEQDHALAMRSWEEDKKHYLEEQRRQNDEIDKMRSLYESKSHAAILEYCERVLSRCDYPACIPREFDLEFNPETGALLLDHRLPAPSDLPELVEVKYVQSTDSFKEILLSEPQRSKLYDDVVYQVALRTMHELFRSDAAGAISAVVFNGLVTSTDKSTGNEVTACILSVQALREAFLAIHLAKVEPKACFRQLKGVGSSKLHSVTPVAPIVALNRDDRRFVQAYAVAERLNEGFNLAAMDWEDFEHLVREIFAREFSSAGAEVKVTQASRDGGVDAVVFDPDPIRGGKIVIQAKRYAYTVGVSAVRDLYGTVMNEGASKGILVTTSDYGPDAYEFVSGKPLTLLSGSNLLHLLAKHGIGAHIDLNEARKVAHHRESIAV